MTRLEEQKEVRLNKLKNLLKLKINPFPSATKRDCLISQAINNFEKLVKEGKEITLAGRIKTLRLHGGSCFGHLEDASDKIQIYLKKDDLGEKNYNLWRDSVDLGDLVEIRGHLFRTKTGEKTLKATSFKFLAKTLRPLPEKWHGLSNIETRYRQRYLDLMVNEEIKAIFAKRNLIIKTLREFLDQEGFIEVETPTLQPIPGGANARPFITHHHALKTDLYLRIAPELYLKRLIVGGMEKVYEIAKCFRNEGIDALHNPEFTQLEFYAAYWDYQKMMEFTEQLLVRLLNKVNKNLELEYEKKKINFTPPFERLSFKKAIDKYAGLDLEKIDSDAVLIKEAKKLNLTIDKTFGRPKILDEIYKEVVRPNLIQPTFLIDHPIELSPLAKRKESEPHYAERFQLVVAGLELVNAFSELNDPIDQLERFKAQEKLRKGGDEEAQRIDEDFIEALEYGMPTAAGFGLGLDRLTALLTNSHNIKEVILFPALKPKND